MCKEHYEKERDALRKFAFWSGIAFSDGKIQREVKKDEVRRVRRKRGKNIRLQAKTR
jgi:U3 small nucleolar ribonucleoprotein component